MGIKEDADVSEDKQYSEYVKAKHDLDLKLICNSHYICENKPEKKAEFGKCYESSLSQKSLSDLDMKKLSDAEQMCEEMWTQGINKANYVRPKHLIIHRLTFSFLVGI